MTEPFELKGLSEAANRALRKRKVEREIATDPSPGDLLRPRQGWGRDVDWLVVLSTKEKSPRCLILPRDRGHWVGTGDVSLADGPGDFSGVVRCDFEVWMQMDKLSGSHRLAHLGGEALERVRRTWSGLQNSRSQGHSRLAIDDSPDFRDWLDEVVRPAHEQMMSAASAPSESPGIARISASTRRVQRQFLEMLAAAAIIVVALGAYLGISGIERRLDGMTLALDEQRSELEEIRFQATEKLEKILFTLNLSQSSEVGDLFNNPLVKWMDDRRGEQELRVAKHFTLVILGVRCSGEARDAYQLNLESKEPVGSVWKANDLRPDPSGDVWAGLPVEIVRSGSYRLTLAQKIDGSYQPVKTFDLLIVFDD